MNLSLAKGKTLALILPRKSMYVFFLYKKSMTLKKKFQVVEQIE